MPLPPSAIFTSKTFFHLHICLKLGNLVSGFYEYNIRDLDKMETNGAQQTFSLFFSLVERSVATAAVWYILSVPCVTDDT